MKRSSESLRAGFSLVELLASITLLIVLMGLFSVLLKDIEGGWSRVRRDTLEFRDARTAFETIANRLSQARIDTYWDYEMGDNGIPSRYKKESHLHFITANAAGLIPGTIAEGKNHAVFFEAPFGMTREADLKGLSSLVNGWGYFSGFGDNLNWQPGFLRSENAVPPKYRFRLFEFHLPTERVRLHGDDPDNPDTYTKGTDWITDHLEANTVSVLAENVVLFVVHPLIAAGDKNQSDTLTANYEFDSRDATNRQSQHEVPPMLRVTMVVVAEEDFALHQAGNISIPEEFDLEEIAPFKRTREYTRDLESLKQHFENKRIDYRVFSTVVALRTAKWTNTDI